MFRWVVAVLLAHLIAPWSSAIACRDPELWHTVFLDDISGINASFIAHVTITPPIVPRSEGGVIGRARIDRIIKGPADLTEITVVARRTSCMGPADPFKVGDVGVVAGRLLRNGEYAELELLLESSYDRKKK
jgi:hypothetical protein